MPRTPTVGCQPAARGLVLVLAGLMMIQPALLAQTGNLRLIVVEGAGANNVIQQIPAQPVVVRVEDASGLPVVGANVIFSAPETGPSGEFSNEETAIGVITGPDGLASAGAYHPNAEEGTYQISVRAEFQGQSVVTAVEQRNIGPGGGRGRTFAILGILGAAAGAAAAVALSRNTSGAASQQTSPSIVFDNGVVGAPAP